MDYCLNKNGIVERCDEKESVLSDEVSSRECAECKSSENLFYFDEDKLSKEEIEKILDLSERAIDEDDEEALKEIKNWIKKLKVIESLEK